MVAGEEEAQCTLHEQGCGSKQNNLKKNIFKNCKPTFIDEALSVLQMPPDTLQESSLVFHAMIPPTW